MGISLKDIQSDHPDEDLKPEVTVHFESVKIHRHGHQTQIVDTTVDHRNIFFIPQEQSGLNARTDKIGYKLHKEGV